MKKSELYEKTVQFTHAEALLWLAALEKDCPNTRYSHRTDGVGGLFPCPTCGGTGKVAVLSYLREPCPNNINRGTDRANHILCPACQGHTWVPKLGRQAIQDSMVDAGWICTTVQIKTKREVMFLKMLGNPPNERYACGEDADDWLAAIKAIKMEVADG